MLILLNKKKCHGVIFYGTRNNPHTNPDFEQTRTYTVDSDLGPQQENEQGIRLGRVDYSIRNK